MTLSSDQVAELLEHAEFAYPITPWDRVKPFPDGLFLGDAYYKQFGTWHRGIDLNGTGGSNTDLGMVIQSMFPGTVVEIDARPGWGPVVLVRAHEWVRQFAERVLDRPLKTLDVQYAHLHHVCVEKDETVNAGDALGSMGTGARDLEWGTPNTAYYSHLHLEVRHKAVPAIVPQQSVSKSPVLAECLDPLTVLKQLKFSKTGNIQPCGLRVAPLRFADYNGDRDQEQRLAKVHLMSDDKLYIRDGREQFVPKSFWQAWQHASRLWRDANQD